MGGRSRSRVWGQTDTWRSTLRCLRRCSWVVSHRRKSHSACWLHLAMRHIQPCCSCPVVPLRWDEWNEPYEERAAELQAAGYVVVFVEPAPLRLLERSLSDSRPRADCPASTNQHTPYRPWLWCHDPCHRVLSNDRPAVSVLMILCQSLGRLGICGSLQLGEGRRGRIVLHLVLVALALA